MVYKRWAKFQRNSHQLSSTRFATKSAFQLMLFKNTLNKSLKKITTLILHTHTKKVPIPLRYLFLSHLHFSTMRTQFWFFSRFLESITILWIFSKSTIVKNFIGHCIFFKHKVIKINTLLAVIIRLITINKLSIVQVWISCIGIN